MYERHLFEEKLPPEIREKIRKEVRSGKSKTRVAREYNINPTAVYNCTYDIISEFNYGIAGNSLKLLEEIMKKGYATKSKIYNYKAYQTLHKRFPNIRRVKMYGRVIYFLRERSDNAMRAFLEITKNKKIMSGHELQQIIDVFGANVRKKNRKKFYL